MPPQGAAASGPISAIRRLSANVENAESPWYYLENKRMQRDEREKNYYAGAVERFMKAKQMARNHGYMYVESYNVRRIEQSCGWRGFS